MSSKLTERIKGLNVSNGQVILSVFLILQFVCLFFVNLTLVTKRIDWDSANLFTHMIRMAEEKTYIIPGWLYTTSLEIDCSVLLAMPIYMITKSIGVSVAISNLIFALVFIYVWFRILKKESLWVRLIFANLVLIPYNTGMLDYYNMMFFAGGQYLIRVLIVSILILILLEAEKPTGKKSYYVLSGLFVALLFVTSLSSGIYEMLMGLFPVVAVYFLIHFVNWEKVPVYIWVLGVVSLFSACLGIMLNNRIFIGERYTLGINYTALAVMYEYPDRVFWGVFELFGAVSYLGDQPALSLEGVFFLFRFVFAMLIYTSLGYAIWRIFKKKASRFEKITVGLALWNLFINTVFMTCYATGTFEYRYHLLVAVPSMALIGKYTVELVKKFKLPQQKRIIAAILTGLIVSVGAYHYVKMIGAEDQNIDAEEIAEFCESMGCDQVYVYFSQEMAELTRFFSGGKKYTRMLANGHIYIRDYYLEYQDNTIAPTEKTLFVFSVEDGAAFGLTPETGGDFDQYELVPIKQIGDYIVFSLN